MQATSSVVYFQIRRPWDSLSVRLDRDRGPGWGAGYELVLGDANAESEEALLKWGRRATYADRRYQQLLEAGGLWDATPPGTRTWSRPVDAGDEKDSEQQSQLDHALLGMELKGRLAQARVLDGIRRSGGRPCDHYMVEIELSRTQEAEQNREEREIKARLWELDSKQWRLYCKEAASTIRKLTDTCEPETDPVRWLREAQQIMMKAATRHIEARGEPKRREAGDGSRNRREHARTAAERYEAMAERARTEAEESRWWQHTVLADRKVGHLVRSTQGTMEEKRRKVVDRCRAEAAKARRKLVAARTRETDEMVAAIEEMARDGGEGGHRCGSAS